MRISDLGAVEQSAAPKQFDFSGIKLFIAIPTRGTCSVQFAMSLATTCSFLTAKNIDHILFKHVSSCHVHFSRNVLLAEFLRTDCTHILQVDDDMGFDAVAVLQMLTHDKDFIAGVGNIKTDKGDEYACKIDVNEHTQVAVTDKNGLIKASFVGGAFTLIKREAIEKMISQNMNLRNARVDASYGYTLYQDRYADNGFETEDYTFCRRWTEIGGEIWIYPDITFVHTGSKDYVGNYHEFLKAQPPLAPTVESLMAGFHSPADLAPRPRVEKNGLQKAITREVEKAIDKIAESPSYIAKVSAAVKKMTEEGSAEWLQQTT
jgi:hypothetical protein